MTATIRIQRLTKRFGRTRAVDDVTLEIPAGDSVALWGVNGAGKTTIIRCVLGLLRFRGTIEVGGQSVRRRGKHARKLIGYVPQELGFYDDLGVAEAVAFFARLKGVAMPAGGVDAALEAVGLVGHNRKRIRELSGGMKQRLALAIALLGDPPILVLDEVTASLDACGREEFVSLLARLTASGKSGAGGRTMLFASHRVEEVTTIAKRVVILDKGRVVSQVAASQFVPHLGQSAAAMLHLHIKSAARESAIHLLRTHGFDPRLNGVGLLVPVPLAQKAAPFRVLAEGHISVDDFELITSAAAVEHAAQEMQA
jgi:ABC-type multidrug transport system ATPase subunit